LYLEDFRGFLWFSSFPILYCSDSTLKQAMITGLHFLSYLSSTLILWYNVCAVEVCCYSLHRVER
jgi:hypothetical protein